MKKLGVTVLTVGAVFLLASPAWAEGTIPWAGNGSDNLPCADGAHWVVAPAFGIESATLTVDGVDYVMTQSGNGSWSADSSGAIDDTVNAYVTYTGPGDDRDHLQLSHCLGASPSPSESESPSPTESPSPSETESPSPTNSPSVTGSPSVRPTSHTPTTSVKGASHTPSPTAFTGSNGSLKLTGLAGLLALVGAGLLRLGSRKRI